MKISSEQLRAYPLIQLDHSLLDVVELILGGLLDTSVLDFKRVLDSMENSVPNGDELSRVVLADPDGTPLALAEYEQGISPSDAQGIPVVFRVHSLSDAEHGAFRDVRITAPLGDQPVVLFDDAPSATNLASLLKLAPLPANTRFVLLGKSSAWTGPEHAHAMDELKAVTSCFQGTEYGHVVIPDDAPTSLVVERLSTNVLADFRRLEHLSSKRSEGMVILFSGLSGSGKSTLARAVQEHIHRQLDVQATLLDGDDIRRFVSKGLGFSPEDRETNVERIGWIGARVSEAGGIALCAPIAPFQATREAVRALAEQVGKFYLIYVSTPLEICEQRDRKGLYAKARAGFLKDFTGIDSPYEKPTDADLILDLSVIDIPGAADQVLAMVRR